MADLLKNELDLEYLKTIQKELVSIGESESSDLFLKKITLNWDALELKDRYQKVALVLGDSLKGTYSEQLEIVIEIGSRFKGLKALAFPHFVAHFGLDHFEESLEALAKLTQYSSSEFAIRPFISRDPSKAFAYIEQWRTSENEHIRRLSSEGIRPFLPWAERVTYLTENPKKILLTIDSLKNDDSKYVRTSVANTINDLSKIDVDLVSSYLAKNLNQSEHTDWILKKGMRTLLKEGNSTVLKLFGYNSKGVDVSDLNLKNELIRLNERVHFSFEVRNNSALSKKSRIEYHMFFMKNNGRRSKKVFQIFDGILKPNENKSIEKSYKFQDLTTRKHYEGEHEIAVTVNGVEVQRKKFEFRI